MRLHPLSSRVEKAQKSIDFNWESGVLQQISSAKEDWVVRFNYFKKKHIFL